MSAEGRLELRSQKEGTVFTIPRSNRVSVGQIYQDLRADDLEECSPPKKPTWEKGRGQVILGLLTEK